MSRMQFGIAVWGIVLGAIVNAQELPPLEAYASLPVYDLYELSPDGERGAMRYTTADTDVVVVKQVRTGEIVAGVDASVTNPRSVEFVGQDKLLLVAGTTVRSSRIRGAMDYSSGFSLDLKSSSVNRLLTRAEGLYPYQSGLGNIVGTVPGKETVLMPAFSGRQTPLLSLYSVELDSGRESLVAKGNSKTINWFVNGAGEPFIREDFDDRFNTHSIWRVLPSGYNDKLLYKFETDIRKFNIVGMTPARDFLVTRSWSREAGGVVLNLLSTDDGSIRGPLFNVEGKDIEWVLRDIDMVVHGVEYSGFMPTYAFFDSEIESAVNAIQERLPGLAARLVSWDEGFSKLVFHVEGGWTSGAYLMFDDPEAQPSNLGLSRPDIGKAHIAPVEITGYEAQDGLNIPALLTVRDDIRASGDAPLIVMPHGGPEAHDVYGFDWMAQYFASRGYAVLQPQFRGSDGFGLKHRNAGDGELGGKMLSDLDDGVRFLVDKGIVDPQRVCIFGASYGGYAALAAGAFSPDLYKCVAAYAPVSDFREMLEDTRSTSWVRDYWEDYYGGDIKDKKLMRSISPVFHADKFQAPVLLIHGRDDTVVEPAQSRIMRKALRKAGKDVELVEIKGADHWMSKRETRVETLRQLASFIEQHL